MALSLTIFPLKFPDELKCTIVFCRDRLRFSDDNRLTSQFFEKDDKGNRKIKTHVIPEHFKVEVCEEEGVRVIRKDAYNGELTYILAGELSEKLVIPESVSNKNEAIKAFVDALSPDIPIILYWS